MRQPLRAVGLVALTLLTLGSFAPLISVILAGTVATVFDCPLDEGSVHPCLVGAIDLGETLYTAGVLGWLMFLTWPGMILCLGLWFWIAVCWLLRRWRRGGS